MPNQRQIALLNEIDIYPGYIQNFQTFLPVLSDGSSDVFAAGKSTAFTDNYPPSYAGNSITGLSAKSYRSDFYSKIRYFDKEFQLGAITSIQTRQLYIVNTILNQSNLLGASILGGEGIIITGLISPYTFQPYEYQLVEVQILIDGPATINAEIVFDWQDPVEDDSVMIFGSRIVAFPYIFSSGMRETLEWLTQIMTSYSGEEQRIKVRNIPRSKYSVEAHIPIEHWNISDNLLYGWRGNTWGVPLFFECREVIAPITAGDLVVNVDTSSGSFRVGELAIIYDSLDNYELFQVEDISSSTLTAQQPFLNNYPLGSLIAPVFACIMDTDPIRRISNGSVRIIATFTATNGFIIQNQPPELEYLGEELFLDEQLIPGQSAPDSYNRRVDFIDFDTNLPRAFSPWDKTKVSRQYLVATDDIDELWSFRQWLYRRNGRFSAFWQPSHESNFTILTTGILGTLILIKDEEQATLAPTRKHIIFYTVDNYYVREILSIEKIIGGVNITLSTSLGIDAKDIIYSSYLHHKRLATDKVEIIHNQNFVSECTISTMEL